MDETTPKEGLETDQDPQPEFRRIVFYSLLTGLCPLIPVPFLDDWTRDHLRKRLTYELSRKHSLDLGTNETSILATGETEITVRGCVRGCLSMAVIKPIVKIAIKLLQKIFRKILIFLTFKDCVDTFSHTFHESYLINHALGRCSIQNSRESCRATRQTIERVTKEVDPRPVEKLARQTFKGSRKLLVQASKLLGKMMAPLRRQELEHEDAPQTFTEPLDTREEEEMLGSVVDRLVAALKSEEGYLEGLKRRFDDRSVQDFSATSTDSASPDSAL